jgi:hypothetical protein
MVIFQVITYIFAGAIAPNVLGGSVSYPPSPEALFFLRDPRSGYGWLLPSQPRSLGDCSLQPCCCLSERPSGVSAVFQGGFLLGIVLFVLRYVAASGGMIEHMVSFIPIPLSFYSITFVEVLIQTLLLGLLVMWWEGRLNRDFSVSQEEPPVYIE